MEARVRLLVLALISFPLVFAADTVTILDAISTAANQHDCVVSCLYNLHGPDVGVALKCATDYVNDCYCATATASLSAATSWFSQCASSACSAGDINGDFTVMNSVYAAYCMKAGFTQPGATAWVSPTAASTSAAPGNTGQGSPPPTTTQVTFVTHTATSSAGPAVSQTQGKFLLPLVVMALVLLQVLLPSFCFLPCVVASRGTIG
jgi:hypothetical protein